MTRQIFAGLFSLVCAVHAFAQNDVSGRVVQSDGSPVDGANVVLTEVNLGAISNENGNFVISSVTKGEYTLNVSYIGYNTLRKEINVDGSTDVGELVIEERSFLGEEVTISALRAGEKTPMAYTDIERDEIVEKNNGRDIPILLNTVPSLISSSDAGHGIGYTSMRIRGTDANRINVTINGVPLNDAESQGVFWVDLPELASSTEQIQVQRGVGTSTNGAAAFGATVNLQTTLLNTEPYLDYETTVGSFNTFRNTVSAGTGIMGDKFSADLRLSDLHSDGYIDRSRTDLQSYYFSAGWHEEKSSLKFITFGGFEEVYQAWGGVPSEMLKTDRTYNAMGAYTDTAGRTAYYDNQVDHYDQIHYQLHFNRAFSSRLFLNAALHYTIGKGYYEEYEEDQDYSYYDMDYPVIGNDTVFSTNLVRRKWLDNDFYGAIASLTYEGNRSTLIAGGGWNRYYGLHFGRVIWAEYFGDNSPGHQWYKGIGDKYDWNVYNKYYYNISEKITAFADLQLRSVRHIIDGTDANNVDVTQSHDFLFFNPKAGMNFEPLAGHRAFLSYARANREPNRNNYTDAPEGRQPRPETLNDYEAGYMLASENWSAGVTLYYMDYVDQLVLTGELNEVGYPVMTNVEESYRAGVEFEAAMSIYDKLTWRGNLALSSNKIKNFTNYVDNWDYWADPENEPYQVTEDLENSTLAYSPSIVSASELNYAVAEGFSFILISKYVGKQYIDNTSNEQYIIEPYFVNDLSLNYAYSAERFGKVSLNVGVINLLDIKYETNAWLYRYFQNGSEQFMDGYYPQAGRHLMVTMRLEF